MPFSAPLRRLEQLRQQLASLGDPRGSGQALLLDEIEARTKDVLRAEFSTGYGAQGEWQETVRGKQALQSNKLPYAFEIAARDGAVKGVGKSKRDLLLAHQVGHTWQPREVGAQKQFLTFRNGQLAKAGRALNKKGEVRRGYHQTFARAHRIGTRVLAARPIVPTGSLDSSPLWLRAVERGVEAGLKRFAELIAK